MRRDEARALLGAGKDPGRLRRLEKLTGATPNGATFKAVADDYQYKLAREGRAPTTLDKLAWLLSFVPADVGNQPIRELTAADILAVLKKVEARGNLETARRLRSTIGAVFRYGVATARAENDPTAALKGALIAPKVKNRAAITYPVELGRFLRSVETYNGQPEVISALKLLPLVFSRPGEPRMAEWSEFDFERAIWTVPAARTKMRHEHQVPLSRQATAILNGLKPLTGHGRLVFPSLRSKERPISDNTMNASMRRMGYSKDEVTAHGFRATFSTMANESRRFSVDAIERALAHVDDNQVRRAYNRAEFWTERVEMAQWWADHLDSLKAGSTTPGKS
ncbi:tyrosine-type recombinase/integrase [Methylovirgula sp. 4M-Z18]|uniref:tyrosine-type recombinase/integrase n=1 Tax=Methylovirgula sp. 4M-Z18 TaxID=2293567 RepID=UPI0026C894C7